MWLRSGNSGSFFENRIRGCPNLEWRPGEAVSDWAILEALGGGDGGLRTPTRTGFLKSVWRPSRTRFGPPFVLQEREDSGLGSSGFWFRVQVEKTPHRRPLCVHNSRASARARACSLVALKSVEAAWIRDSSTLTSVDGPLPRGGTGETLAFLFFTRRDRRGEAFRSTVGSWRRLKARCVLLWNPPSPPPAVGVTPLRRWVVPQLRRQGSAAMIEI